MDLEQGVVVRVDAEAAQIISLDAALRIVGHPAKLIGAAEIESDQWTLGRLRRERPLFRLLLMILCAHITQRHSRKSRDGRLCEPHHCTLRGAALMLRVATLR
jgi:hypothetical protein